MTVQIKKEINLPHIEEYLVPTEPKWKVKGSENKSIEVSYKIIKYRN